METSRAAAIAPATEYTFPVPFSSSVAARGISPDPMTFDSCTPRDIPV